jgi:hypothetical protein
MLPLGASFLFVLRRLRGGHTYCCDRLESDVYDEAGNVVETCEHKDDFKEW